MDRTAIRETRRLRLLGGALALAAAFALAGVTAAPAQNLHAQLQATQSKLSQAKAREGVLSTTIQRYDAQLHQLEGQVASLRNQIAVVRVQLRRVEAQLARDRQQLKILRARLDRALAVLSERLVSIYKSGQPDAMTVLLNAHGFNDVATRADYLRLIQQQDTHLAGTVRHLRDGARATVHRVKRERDGIAAKKAELAQAERALAARQAQLAAARSRQQSALAQVHSSAQKLEGDVSAIQGKIQAQIQAAQAAAAAQASSTSAVPAGPALPGSSGTGQVSSAGFIWPVNGPITSPFCEQRAWESCHPGIDIGVPSGTPIHAAADGTVMFTQSEASSGGYGNYTCIDHGNGLSTCYAHQESFAVSQGQHVSQGQVIGYTDCTGLCFGPHLHFEVRINGAVTDPMSYLP